MDLNVVTDKLVSAAKKLLPLAVPGAGPIIAVAEDVWEALTQLPPTADAQETLAELAARVSAHADHVRAKLEGRAD